MNYLFPLENITVDEATPDKTQRIAWRLNSVYAFDQFDVYQVDTERQNDVIYQQGRRQ